MILAAHLLAAASPDLAGSLSGYIVQFGVVGLLLLDVGVTRKVFVPRWTLDNEKEERERERAAMQERIEKQAVIISDLTDHFINDVVPALTRSTDVEREYIELERMRRR